MSEADLEPIDENLAPTDERPGWAKSLGLEKASEEPKVEVPEGEESTEPEVIAKGKKEEEGEEAAAEAPPAKEKKEEKKG